MGRTCILFALCLATVAVGEDFGHVFWADGFRGRSSANTRELHLLTSRYGAAIDVEKAQLLHLGTLDTPLDYVTTATAPQGIVRQLPRGKLELAVRVGNRVYTCVEGATKLDDDAAYPIRLIDSGRFLNRIDLLGLTFKDAEGELLPAKGRLELAAWPDRLCLTLELSAEAPIDAGTLKLSIGSETRPAITTTVPFETTQPGDLRRVHAVWGANEPTFDPSQIQVREGSLPPFPVTYSPLLGAYVVALPARQWAMAEHLDRLDRYTVTLENPGTEALELPLVFAMEGAFQGVTGLVPMLRNTQGEPTGIAVQISKNWHKRPERRLLYEGAWFHGVTRIPVAAGSTWQGEFCIAYARWGGVPAASHAQLSLVGWGGNQRWDQAAIGSFGESICYDPDVGLNRSMIDDIRPLMVRGMNDGQWEWTHNVGGGDFLVLFDRENQKQYLSGVRTAYLSQGPNLTRVVYGGHTPDAALRASIEVSTPRCDDINRAYHRIRYDVDAPLTFSRLALYQLGADGYNDHQFTRIARGNLDGLLEEWETPRGGKRYLREAAAASGRAPWVALLGGMRSPALTKGAWADRAMVVRHWKARLGGQEVPEPHFGFYGTENGPHSANVELVPPPGLTQLLPGDFVEAEIELLILPQAAADYYGPNAGLRTALEDHAGTWQAVHRLARGNDLQVESVTAGTLIRSLPLRVVTADGAHAECAVRGGVGYVPVQFTGLRAPHGHTLWLNDKRVDQSVHGNDFWQVDRDADGTYTLTYNVDLDQGGPTHTLRLGPTPGTP